MFLISFQITPQKDYTKAAIILTQINNKMNYQIFKNKKKP